MATRNKVLNVDSLTDQERATWQNPINPGNGALNLPMIQAADDEEEETATDRVAAMLGSALEDDKAFVKVQRVIGPNKYAHCEQYSISDYERGGASMIREEWGPGEYDIRLYGVKPETGKFGVRAKVSMMISEKRGESASVPAKHNSELAQVLQTIAQGQQQMLQALTEKPVAPDPMAQMAQMMALMGTMREALGLNGGNQSQSQLKDIVAAMREMKEVSAEFAPKESEPDSMMSMLPNILELVKTGMHNQQAAPQLPVTIYPQPEVPHPQSIQSPVAQTPESQPTGDENVNLGAVALLGHLTRLIGMAHAKVDPQLGADVLYEKLPDEFIDLMAAPEWFVLLSQVKPDVKPYEEWFTKARDRTMEMFAEAEEPEAPPSSPTA